MKLSRSTSEMALLEGRYQWDTNLFVLDLPTLYSRYDWKSKIVET